MLTRLQRLAVRLRHPIVISAIVGCALSVAASRALINVGGAAKVDLYRRAANNRLTTIQRLAETDLALVRSVAQSLELAPPGMNETHARRWLCPFAGDSHDLRLFGFLPLSSSTGLADSIALHNCRPAAGDQRVVLETNRRWKKFLDQSTASGQPVLTPAFRPEIEGQTGAVSLILMPVLDRGRLRGHAVAALEYSRVVERAVARFESYGVHVGLTEWTPGEPERMLAFHQSRRAETRIQPLETVIEAETASGSVTTTVNVGGRRWLGYCLPVPEVVQPEPSAGLGALVFGLFATAMLCLYLRSMQARTRVVEKLVTHRTQELAAARDQAVEASKLKSDFLATVSHEVRTPLNGVMGLTDLLAETPLNGDQRDLVDSLRGSATSLMVILNDILDLSKMEAGKFSLASEPFDLPAVVEQATQLFAGQAAKKGLSLSCQLPDEVCLRLEGDAGRLGQVLSNLVGNAVKFTNQGMVSVSVELLARQAEVAEFCISVRDTGIGIDPVLGRKLFQPFTQVDASSARRHGGTGLGLAICRGLVQLMGGEAGFESEPGRGSHFWVTTRLRLIGPTAEAQQAVAGLACSDVLLLGKSPSLLVAGRYLQDWGAHVQAVPSIAGAEPLLAAVSAGPRLVVAAWTSAAGASQLLRLIGNRATTIFLAAPGSSAAVDPASALILVAEPIRRSRLKEALRQALEAGETEPSPSPLPPVALEPLAMQILVVEDNPVNQMVAMGLLKKLGYQAQAVDGGREAVMAVQQGSYKLILMDCQMPEMDGYEATAAIRQLPAPASATPIVALTANSMPGDRERCLAAGMDDYLSKPVQLARLAEALERWSQLESNHAFRDVPTGAPVPEGFDNANVVK